jgi:competence ComEA-like helix-hairpin-helix protein
MFGLLLAMGLLAWGHVFEVGGAFSKAAAARVRVNVNSADADTLALLPEIGKDRAAKIVEYRTEHGPFHGYPDLLRVTGIGEKTVEKLIHEICFSDEPAPAEPAQSSEDGR